MAVQLDVTHEGAHNFKLKFDWMSQPVDQMQFAEIDAGALKEWQVLRVEGEEETTAQQSMEDFNKKKDKAKPAKVEKALDANDTR